ncbi:MAG: anti-sigma factor antagonist [Gaiellales bacterium]|jgi:anti-sigma B factor antagonist|nr:anti-sigma factor antagonist [Gaiellales bacterium]
MTEDQIEIEYLSETAAAVVLRGEHDIYTVPALRERLGELHEKELHVIIDLSQTTFLDSSVLGAMLGASEHARGQGKGVAIVLGDPPTETVSRIFEVTGLAEVLPTRATRAEAHAMFTRAASG